MVRRVVTTIVLAALLLGGGVVVFMSLAALRKEPDKVAVAPPPPAVRTTTVRRADYAERLTGYGRARPLATADVAAEVNGVIAWVSPKLEAGASVEAGEPLVRFDPRELRNTAAMREAEVAAATARLERTRLDVAGLVDRLKVTRAELAILESELSALDALASEDLVSRRERDRLNRQLHQIERAVIELEWQQRTSDARVAADEADVARAEAMHEQAALDLERVEIDAPFSGRIESRAARVGGRAAVGSVLFRVVDLSRVEVAVALPASRFREVEVGAETTLRLREGQDPVWSGAVTRIAPGVRSGEASFYVYVEVDGTAFANVVPPGEFLVAEVAGAVHRDVLAVPRIAFVEGKVFVVEEDGAAQLSRAVEPTIFRLLPDVALASGGLPDGSRVVISNIEKIGDRSKITVIDGDARDDGEG